METRTALLIALITTFFSVNVHPCGESLYRVGKGVSYRAYSAPLPGNLLFFVNSESTRQTATELSKAGHKVHQVETVREFALEFEKREYDVVIAPYTQRATIESAATRNETARAYFLPMVASNQEQLLAKQSYNRTLTPKDNIKDYLKAIHRAIKIKG